MKTENIELNNLNEISIKLLETIKAKKLATKNETLLKNSIITIYFDTLNNYLKEEVLTKNGVPLSLEAKISSFKIEIMNTIKDDDKLTNNVFSVFNQCTLKKNGLKIEKLRLLDYNTLVKYSKLSNSYISKIDYKLNIKDIVIAINNQYTEFNKNEKIEATKKYLEKNSYNVALKA